MSIHLPDPTRRIIPRWRPSWVTRRLVEIEPSRVTNTFVPSAEWVRECLDDWHQLGGSATASELVGAALVAGVPTLAHDAAVELLDLGPRLSGPARKVAEQVLPRPASQIGEPPFISRERRWRRISDLRNRLHSFPRNALMWLDLAREYTVLGQREPAERAIRLALSLAPSNRFVLRSVARFYLHAEQPETAHGILRRASVTRFDPWLLSAEIASGQIANTPSKFIGSAKDLIQSTSIEPAHLSELACALGTLELSNGKHSAARRLFTLALRSPSENAVAQAGWAARRDGAARVSDVHLNLPMTYEARAWESRRKEDWPGAVEEASKWLRDEPFAARPAIFGSFMAAGIGDYRMSIKFAQNGIDANSDEPILVNNLAFALASQGEVESAVRALAKLSPEALHIGDRIAVTATLGLVEFRSGRPDQGRELYQRAIHFAQAHRLHDTEKWATVYMLCEELRLIGVPRADLIAKARDAAQALPAIDTGLANNIISNALGSLLITPAHVSRANRSE
jgi:tetratricopeptide (TPR) repeat protein